MSIDFTEMNFFDCGQKEFSTERYLKLGCVARIAFLSFFYDVMVTWKGDKGRCPPPPNNLAKKLKTNENECNLDIFESNSGTVLQ